MHDMFLMCPHSIKYFYKEVMFEFCQRSSASNEMIMCFCLSTCLYDRLFFYQFMHVESTLCLQDEVNFTRMNCFFFSCILGLLKLWIILLNSFAIFFMYICVSVFVCACMFFLSFSLYMCVGKDMYFCLSVCLSLGLSITMQITTKTKREFLISWIWSYRWL